MKEFYRNVAAQAVAILIAGLTAALIAFIQSIAIQTGACEMPKATPEEVGLLGMSIKGAHTSWQYFIGKIKV